MASRAVVEDATSRRVAAVLSDGVTVTTESVLLTITKALTEQRVQMRLLLLPTKPVTGKLHVIVNVAEEAFADRKPTVA